MAIVTIVRVVLFLLIRNKRRNILEKSEKEFTGTIKLFCDKLVRTRDKEECHYYKHFNTLIVTLIGTPNIKEKTLFNKNEYAIATQLKKLIIQDIHKYILIGTEYHKAYEEIRKSVQES